MLFWQHWKELIKQGQTVGELPYSPMINATGSRYKVDPTLVAAVIRCESDYNPRALSKAGAVGLMQICIPTWCDLKQGEPEWQSYQGYEADMKALYQPNINIAAGTKYLHLMLSRYQGDPVKAVAAYNAGPGSVDHYGGIPPYQETRRYVHHVASVWTEYRGLQHRSVTWYRWGIVIEKVALEFQIYLLGFYGFLLAVLGGRCWIHRRKRRW
jgi:soluble lytic murein transglycosylase-like protein